MVYIHDLVRASSNLEADIAQSSDHSSEESSSESVSSRAAMPMGRDGSSSDELPRSGNDCEVQWNGDTAETRQSKNNKKNSKHTVSNAGFRTACVCQTERVPKRRAFSELVSSACDLHHRA